MNSYFEIGGELIELSTSPPSSQRPGPSVVRRIAKQPRQGRRGTAGGRKSEKGFIGITSEQLFSKSGSAKRATSAIRMAAALALVDGPLPVGDVLAATVLFAYAGYEVSRIITE